MKTLFYVPRYNKATILHPLVAKYGQCKVTMYPRSSGRGAIASNLISDICRLAGIADIGVKVRLLRISEASSCLFAPLLSVLCRVWMVCKSVSWARKMCDLPPPPHPPVASDPISLLAEWVTPDVVGVVILLASWSPGQMHGERCGGQGPGH